MASLAPVEGDRRRSGSLPLSLIQVTAESRGKLLLQRLNLGGDERSAAQLEVSELGSLKGSFWVLETDGQVLLVGADCGRVVAVNDDAGSSRRRLLAETEALRESQLRTEARSHRYGEFIVVTGLLCEAFSRESAHAIVIDRSTSIVGGFATFVLDRHDFESSRAPVYRLKGPPWSSLPDSVVWPRGEEPMGVLRRDDLDDLPGGDAWSALSDAHGIHQFLYTRGGLEAIVCVADRRREREADPDDWYLLHNLARQLDVFLQGLATG